MASLFEGMSLLEREAHRLWCENAAHIHFGLCDTCGRTHDDDGKHLLVARQARRRIFECLDCWDQRKT